jgi:regulator of protease activity HflC (stomatin/prohibitin superfamily)
MYTEREVKPLSGWFFLVLDLLLWIIAVWLFVGGIREKHLWRLLLGGAGGFVLAGLGLGGLFVVNPNEAIILLLFGAYRGTVRSNGFLWTNPFATRIRISLRARTLNGQKIKVNDRSGNPIEIAVVVVWQVRNTVEAKFEVDNYLDYVNTQSEAALRHLASSYPYDAGEEELSLRGATDEINVHLQRELQERLSRAGVAVLESRLSHLAYAPEIAGAMLQRQQATAIIAARKKIVEGAVGMVEDALQQLGRGNIVQLDEERKASMVSNLLVVLCSEHAAQPVVNAGTLYH